LKNIDRSVFRKLFRMKMRLIGISLVISLAMAMFTAGFYAAEMYDYSIERHFEEAKMPDVFYDLAGNQNRSELDAALSELDSISAYDLRLKTGGVYESNDGPLSVVLIGLEDPSRKDINKLELENGRYFQGPSEAVALAGQEDLGTELDAVIEVMLSGTSINLTITGHVATPEYLFPSAYAEYSIPVGNNLIILYMNLGFLQSVLGEGVNEVIVLLDGPQQEVDATLAQFGIAGVTEQDEHPSLTFMEIGAAKMRNMFPLMGAIFMLVGFISIFMTMFRLVKNDTRYIGVMMSLGYPRKSIVRSYLFLGLMIILIGGTLGVVFALGFTQMIVSIGAEMFFSLNLYYPPVLYPFALGWIFVIVAVLFSVWIPVRSIINVSVREALDYKASSRVHTSRNRRSGMSKITLIGLRNSTRNPGRTALTIFVVGMTIGVAGSWLVMADSAWDYVGELIDADTWDLRADFLQPLPISNASNVEYLGLDPGDVEYIIPFSHMNGQVIFDGTSSGAVIVGCDEMARTKDFQVRSGEPDLSKAVVTDKLAKELEAEVGDTVTVVVGDASRTLEVSCIIADLAPQLFTESDNLASLWPTDMATGSFIKLTGPAKSEIDSRADALRDSPVVSKVVVQDEINETFSTVLDDAMAFLYTFFIINLFIALVVASSAVIISTMERDVEFATLDTLGIPKRKVAFTILVEMAILAVGAALIGIPFSYLFGWLLAKVMEEAVLYFPVVFALGVSISTFVIGYVFVFLSSLVPIRYSNKLDTEKTLRERTAG